jgi:AraC-like DNA-binding protein
VKAWHFTTEDIALSDQSRAWADAMNRLYLPFAGSHSDKGFQGSVSCMVSPLGIEFALVEAEPQEISGSYPKQDKAIWLTILLKGEARLSQKGQAIDLAPGDMLYGPTGEEDSGTKLEFRSMFRQLFIKVPHLAINPRLISPLSLSIGHLPGKSGINHVLSGMLGSLADALGEISHDQLRPMELTLTEILFTCLASQTRGLDIGTAASIRTANLHSICQTIETLLSNPDLTPGMVAKEHGVSLRYLQKLFTTANKTFSNYVRTRRLERCRADLTSPIYSQLSITEICFRWGFNSSAYFSRSFSEYYQVSPRKYRRLHAPHPNTA